MGKLKPGAKSARRSCGRHGHRWSHTFPVGKMMKHAPERGLDFQYCERCLKVRWVS